MVPASESYAGPERRRWSRQTVAPPGALAPELDCAQRLAVAVTASLLAAAAIVTEAEHRVRRSRRLRADVAARRAIFRTLSQCPGQVLVTCAWCARAQVWTGAWVLMPAGVEDALSLRARSLLTHGICPDCSPRAAKTRHAEPQPATPAPDDWSV
jgi:hypothetical protein